MADVGDLEQAVRTRALEIVDLASRAVLDATRDACPVGVSDEAGTLRDSHDVDPPVDAGNVIAADIHADAAHAEFVRDGTRPHVIVPVRARVLRFEVGGDVVYAARVNHPGTAPNTEWWTDEAFAERWSTALEAEVS